MRFAPPMYPARCQSRLAAYSPQSIKLERWEGALHGIALFVAFVGVWTAVFLLALR
ncbi:MAG TPA: hypothetical protein VFB34_05650 [Chloroflexota bacterium]|nr:hypothetical protein [Chloroflexota bacterium]